LALQEQLPSGSSFQLDELESFEELRALRPLTVAVLIEKSSRYIVWAQSARIPARHKKTRHGRRRSGKSRPDCSPVACLRSLRRGAALASELDRIVFETDQKKSYPALIARAFGRERPILHQRISSRRVRNQSNPLFAINQTEALARDLMGRLRRDSWLVSKKRRYLDLALSLFLAWRNLVRRRFNTDEASPAQMLGFAPCRMSEEQLCSWRAEWGRRSIHPLSEREESIDSFQLCWKQRAA
jgi:hypothetical protein